MGLRRMFFGKGLLSVIRSRSAGFPQGGGGYLSQVPGKRFGYLLGGKVEGLGRPTEQKAIPHQPTQIATGFVGVMRIKAQLFVIGPAVPGMERMGLVG